MFAGIVLDSIAIKIFTTDIKDAEASEWPATDFTDPINNGFSVVLLNTESIASNSFLSND